MQTLVASLGLDTKSQHSDDAKDREDSADNLSLLDEQVSSVTFHLMDLAQRVVIIDKKVSEMSVENPSKVIAVK